MCSLINKQLLLTAYAYLFIMEQQKAQQGSEALQLQIMGRTLQKPKNGPPAQASPGKQQQGAGAQQLAQVAKQSMPMEQEEAKESEGTVPGCALRAALERRQMNPKTVDLFKVEEVYNRGEISELLVNIFVGQTGAASGAAQLEEFLVEVLVSAGVTAIFKKEEDPARRSKQLQLLKNKYNILIPATGPGSPLVRVFKRTAAAEAKAELAKLTVELQTNPNNAVPAGKIKKLEEGIEIVGKIATAQKDEAVNWGNVGADLKEQYQSEPLRNLIDELIAQAQADAMQKQVKQKQPPTQIKKLTPGAVVPQKKADGQMSYTGGPMQCKHGRSGGNCQDCQEAWGRKNFDPAQSTGFKDPVIVFGGRIQ